MVRSGVLRQDAGLPRGAIFSSEPSFQLTAEREKVASPSQRNEGPCSLHVLGCFGVVGTQSEAGLELHGL